MAGVDQAGGSGVGDETVQAGAHGAELMAGYANGPREVATAGGFVRACKAGGRPARYCFRPGEALIFPKRPPCANAQPPCRERTCHANRNHRHLLLRLSRVHLRMQQRHLLRQLLLLTPVARRCKRGPPYWRPALFPVRVPRCSAPPPELERLLDPGLHAASEILGRQVTHRRKSAFGLTPIGCIILVAAG